MRLASTVVLAIVASWSLAVAQTVAPVIPLRVGKHHISAEVAATPDTRDKGLMNRNELPANRGMLFSFPKENSYCMWMHNTTIPLSVAFIDAKGAIVNIAEMTPGTDDYYCSDRQVRYALEMNYGWFRKKMVLPGVRIKDISRIPSGW